jgi:myo-inositol catabolism protein IolS
MQKRTLGTSNLQISPIIMGTWQAGKRMWVGIEDSETIKAIRSGFEAGITTIDTAEVYGTGHSEQIVAQALSDVRSQVVYASKVFPNHLKYDQVIEACDRSLANLKTDYIDLYYIHWPSGTWNSEIVPIAETMEALNSLKQDGKIRAIGVSNFSKAQLEEASEFGRIDALQPPYSLFWRKIEPDLTNYCLEHKISILAYSPLAQGLLTGKFNRGHQFAEGDHRVANKLFHGENYERSQLALEKLQPIADHHHTTLGNLALAWLIFSSETRPQVQAIAGARNAEQSIQNAKAADVNLTKEDWEEIEAIGRYVTDFLDATAIMWDF